MPPNGAAPQINTHQLEVYTSQDLNSSSINPKMNKVHTKNQSLTGKKMGVQIRINAAMSMIMPKESKIKIHHQIKE